MSQTSKQIAIGLFKNFKDNTFEASIEGYYKTMNNLVLFKEGAQSLQSADIDTKLTFGKGNSYGTELFDKRTWVSSPAGCLILYHGQTSNSIFEF